MRIIINSSNEEFKPHGQHFKLQGLPISIGVGYIVGSPSVGEPKLHIDGFGVATFHLSLRRKTFLGTVEVSSKVAVPLSRIKAELRIFKENL